MSDIDMMNRLPSYDTIEITAEGWTIDGEGPGDPLASGFQVSLLKISTDVEFHEPVSARRVVVDNPEAMVSFNARSLIGTLSTPSEKSMWGNIVGDVKMLGLS